MNGVGFASVWITGVRTQKWTSVKPQSEPRP